MRLTRRGLLGLGAAGAAAAASGAYARAQERAPAEAAVVPFHGRHQAGIDTPQQDRLHFAAFDVTPGMRAADLADLLRTWSAAAARMTAGRPAGAQNADALAPPDDTGEALGLTPGRLTVTFGVGPSLF